MRDVIEIETKRLKLRKLRMSDAPAITRYLSDPGVGRNLGMTPQPYLLVAAEGWIMINAAREPRGRDFVFAIERTGDGLVGVMGAHRKEGDAVEVGYWIGRAYWGQGFATEALDAFVAEARKLGALEAGHFVDNPASGRVLTKAGFAYTGVVEPHFSMSRGENAPCKRMRYAPEAAARIHREAALAH